MQLFREKCKGKSCVNPFYSWENMDSKGGGISQVNVMDVAWLHGDYLLQALPPYNLSYNSPLPSLNIKIVLIPKNVGHSLSIYAHSQTW